MRRRRGPWPAVDRSDTAFEARETRHPVEATGDNGAQQRARSGTRRERGASTVRAQRAHDRGHAHQKSVSVVGVGRAAVIRPRSRRPRRTPSRSLARMAGRAPGVARTIVAPPPKTGAHALARARSAVALGRFDRSTHSIAPPIRTSSRVYDADAASSAAAVDAAPPILRAKRSAARRQWLDSRQCPRKSHRGRGAVGRERTPITPLATSFFFQLRRKKLAVQCTSSCCIVQCSGHVIIGNV